MGRRGRLDALEKQRENGLWEAVELAHETLASGLAGNDTWRHL